MTEKRCEQGDEFYQWLFHFDAGDVQYATKLIKQRIRKPKPTRLPPRAWYLLGAERPIVIGAEPLLIGAEDAPRSYAPAEPMRPVVGLALVPAPRIVDEHPDWPGRELLRGLRSDPGLVVGVASLALALVWWYWLAHGGEAIGIAQREAGSLFISMLLLYMPIYLCIASGIALVASILPDWDFFWMDLQRR